MPTEQRRGRKIAMDQSELDAFLAAQRTCRLATSSPRGPHLTALWFAWDGTALWLYSVVKSQRWTDLTRDGRVAVLVDDGEEYGELRGAELRGTVEFIGAVPWTGAPDPELATAERLIAGKYYQAETMTNPDGRHAWLRLVPDKVTSWDFRKIPG
jgi:Pyridoxamine 5'-phosphate oxidase